MSVFSLHSRAECLKQYFALGNVYLHGLIAMVEEIVRSFT